MREIRIEGIRRVLRLSSSPRTVAREVDEEIRFHLDSRTEELIGAGMRPAAARERAEAEYGDADASRRELVAVDRRRLKHDNRREQRMSFVQDLRYAARGLARRPALLVVTTTTLTIGIAANTVMFGVVDQLLIRAPAGVVDPDRVKRVYYQETREGKVGAQPVTAYPMIPQLRENVPAYSHVAAVAHETSTLGRGVAARSVDVQVVSGNYFDLLGVRPQLGRTFVAAEDRVPESDRVVVVSDRFWKSDLGEAPDVMGRHLEIGGKDFVVVGVAPDGFSGIDRLNVDLWVPIAAVAAEGYGEGWHNTPNASWVQVIARLEDDATPEQAEVQSTAAYRALLREWKQTWRDSTGRVVLGPVVATRTPNGLSADGRISLWLMGVSGIVLLIACANVANLLIARTMQRRREIAVRLALGVSRSRLLRMLLTESMLLAGIGAVASLLVSYWAGRVVQQTLLPGIVWSGAVVDGRVLAFTLVATISCVLLAGIAPALQGVRTPVTNGLKEAAGDGGGSRHRLRTTLLVVQASLSIVLLIGAGLFVRSLRNVSNRDVGIDLAQVLRVTMSLRSAGFERPQIEEIYRLGQERLRGVPGVQHVSMVRGSVPLASGNAMGFRIPGVDSLPSIPGGGPYGSVVQSNFLPTIGARMIRGRDFTADEDQFPARTMIINELLAKAYFGDRDPVGTCVIRQRDSVCTTIVGVAENVMLFSLIKDDRAMIYVPSRHPTIANGPPQAILVRVADGSDAGAVASRVRTELQRLSPGMPFVRVSPFEELVAPQLRPWKLGATMFALLGGIALAIAVVGLYGVMAFLVSQRTHEIGVRMALGANARNVVGLVAWQSVRAVALGLAIGVMVALLASRWIADLLYETSPRDPVVYGAAALALAFAAALASIAPARRATSINPTQALRAD